MTERHCELCGRVFIVRYPSMRKRFCDKSCSRIAQLASLPPLGERNPNWRGGKTKHPLYESYLDMVARCKRPSHPRFADYGGRGITVCERWRESFWSYVEDVGDRPEGKSLDRIDNDGNYESGNVRWASAVEQANNKRGFGPDLVRNQQGQFTSERAS